ncbi:MAG: hypothetical protein PVH48_08220 [Cyclobacteriaceae bacterium]|jgi:hypothetical protein
MIKFKNVILVIVLASIILACTPEKKPEVMETPAVQETMPVSLAYDPSYSASFELGNPAYAEMIVQGSWKDWEDDNLDNMANWVCDTITAFHSDNEVVYGLENLMARWKEARSEYTSSVPTINAVMSIRSTDRNEDWVLVWATSIDTKTDGAIDTVALMETWRINADGKADMLLQFDRANRKE